MDNQSPLLPGVLDTFPFDPRVNLPKKVDNAAKPADTPTDTLATMGNSCCPSKDSCCPAKTDDKKEITPEKSWHWPWEPTSEKGKTNILIISLTGSAGRRAYMTRQCNALQQPCTFIDAVAGSQLTAPMVDDVAHHAKMRLSRNEVGCFLSHKTCWRKIVDDKLPYAVIVEDDVHLDKGLVELSTHYIPQLELVDPNWDVLFLGFNHDVDFKSHFQGLKSKNMLPGWTPTIIRNHLYDPEFWKDKDTSSSLFVQPRPRWGLFGSVISQKGAKKILDFVAKDGINWPVDWQLWFMRDRPIGEPGLHVYAIKDAVQPGKDGALEY